MRATTSFEPRCIGTSLSINKRVVMSAQFSTAVFAVASDSVVALPGHASANAHILAPTETQQKLAELVIFEKISCLAKQLML